MCIMVVGSGRVCEQVCMPVVILLCVCCTMIPGNNIGAEGVKALAPQIEHLSQLTELKLFSE